jgi:hypothetical protein
MLNHNITVVNLINSAFYIVSLPTQMWGIFHAYATRTTNIYPDSHLPLTGNAFHQAKTIGSWMSPLTLVPKYGNAGNFTFVSIHMWGWPSRYSDWLRAGWLRNRSSSSDKVKSFSSPCRPERCLGPTQPPIQWVLGRGAVSPGLKRTRHEADHSPQN